MQETTENRRFSQKTADFRRKPKIFAENRRKPQIGLRHLRSVTLSSARRITIPEVPWLKWLGILHVASVVGEEAQAYRYFPSVSHVALVSCKAHAKPSLEYLRRGSPRSDPPGYSQSHNFPSILHPMPPLYLRACTSHHALLCLSLDIPSYKQLSRTCQRCCPVSSTGLIDQASELQELPHFLAEFGEPT